MKYVAVEKVDNSILIGGDLCITTPHDLYTILVDKDTTEIELRKCFINKYFTYVALCEFVEHAASIAPDVRIWAADTVYDNTLAAVKDIQAYQEPDEFLYALQYNPSRLISTVQLLCDSYMKAHDEAAEASNKIATMLVQINDLQQQLTYKAQDLDKLHLLNNDANAKLHALVSRVNFRYEKTVNPDTMFTSKENKYNHILYIKEITRVHYTDTLIYYVEEILKTMYSVPVRSVVIEPYYSYGREALYPTFTPHWKLSYQDVYSGDIFMAGYQPKLMEDILQDSNHVNYLLVLDRGGYQVPHIQGDNVTTVYTVSDLKDVPAGIPNDRVIAYSKDTLNIPYITDFDELSLEERIQKYSSTKVVKELINLLEEVQN